MPVDGEELLTYFCNLTPLSKKLTGAVKLGEQWFNEQNEPGSEDADSILSMLKVKCGEKIQVDFDNDDGWTWRDEHSGPFSWMTRSQQDLCILDELDESSQSCARPIRSDQFSKKRLSQQFSVPSCGDDAVGGLSEIQAAFHKFGISNISSDAPTPETISINTLEATSPTEEHKVFVQEESDISSMSDSPVHTTDKSYKSTRETVPEEEKLIAEVHSLHGHISPVFEYDPLDNFIEQQSKTDDISVELCNVNSMSSKTLPGNRSDSLSPKVSVSDERHSDSDRALQLDGVTLENSCFDNPISVNDSWEESDKCTIKAMTESSSNLPSTGFDFLDNW